MDITPSAELQNLLAASFAAPEADQPQSRQRSRYREAAIALRSEAAAKQRLCADLGWSVINIADLTPATLSAVADLLDTLEPDL